MTRLDTDTAAERPEQDDFRTENKIRLVTATSLFNGHDAAINIMRRIAQSHGAEVIHLGHNRSALEIVDAAIQEDAQAIALTSYQGGHNEFFRYVVDLLKERGASHVKVFGGGGGVIVDDEIKALEAYGVAKIYSPFGAATSPPITRNCVVAVQLLANEDREPLHPLVHFVVRDPSVHDPLVEQRRPSSH